MQDIVPSDVAILDLLRKQDGLTIIQLSEAMQVTATAVRQRLTRLMAQGYVERMTCREGRGRPSHQYLLTSKGRRKTGANFADLAVALWQEIRAIKDADVRTGLLRRISGRLAAIYGSQIQGDTLEEALQRAFTELDGFYTLLMATADKMVLVRDAFASKPAIIAETKDYVAVSSEFRSLAHLPGIHQARLFEPVPEEIYSWNV
jgi:predicted transcriptional regulator